MVEQILLSSGSFDRVREIGGFGQPLHTLYPQIQAVLANELGSDAANLLAEPVVDRAHNRIDWYAKGDPDRKPVVVSDLPEEQRQSILAQVQAWLDHGRELAERYAASDDPQRMQLGAMLKAALGSPTETDIFWVDDRPVLAHWGFTTDRPWEMGGPIRRSPAPPIPIAESTKPSEPSLGPPSESPSAKPAAGFTDDTAAPPPLPPSEPVASTETEASPPPLFLKSSPPEMIDRPGALLRYVVVGSRYFWGVAVLAVLLALATFLWVSIRIPTLPLNESAMLFDVTSNASLIEARRIEQALRTELEQRLAELATQRSQCQPPVEPVEPENAVTSSAIAAPSSDAAVATAIAPAIRDKTPPAFQPTSPDIDIKPPSSLEDVATALESSNAPDQAAIATPVLPHHETPPSDPDSPLSVNAPRPSDKSHSPTNAIPSPQTSEESLMATLTETLQNPQNALDAATPQPPIEWPVQAEPTPEEREEFANRLSATGAATGEITATLMWNGDADLDLVIHCPSGHMLDYQNPQACGGTLDVDANTARDSLSNRPVENVFWPAGQAAPGTYRIVVRYAPRKDEQQPQPTPFQIRLIRNNQEKIFRSTVPPNKAAPVTNFNVER